MLLSSTTSNADDLDVTALQKKIYSTIEYVSPSVVSISLANRPEVGLFSGVIVSKEGHVLSAGHAVRPGGNYQVLLLDGRRFAARGKGSNAVADCALLQITSDFDDLPFVQMGESKSFCLLYTSPSPRDATLSRMPSSA